MPTVELRFEDLALAVDLVSRVMEPPGSGAREWLQVGVRAEVPHFRAAFPWRVMPEELRRLADALDEMALEGAAPAPLDEARGALDPAAAPAPAPPRPVRFKPVQPNVILGFARLVPGTITGSYHFRPDYTQAGTLQGSFRAATRDLPDVARRIRAFLDDIGTESPGG